MQSLLDATQPNGRRYYWKSHYLSALHPEAIKLAVEALARMPSPHSAVVLFQLQGALSELPESHSPAGNRDTAFVLNITGSWENAADDAANRQWTRALFEATRGLATCGTYVNFLNEDDGRDRIEEAYGKANLQRLAQLKAQVDPANMFRHTKGVLG
jgi:FAD/FMN-containing dehydrogenase